MKGHFLKASQNGAFSWRLSVQRHEPTGYSHIQVIAGALQTEQAGIVQCMTSHEGVDSEQGSFPVSLPATGLQACALPLYVHQSLT